VSSQTPSGGRKSKQKAKAEKAKEKRSEKAREARREAKRGKGKGKRAVVPKPGKNHRKGRKEPEALEGVEPEVQAVLLDTGDDKPRRKKRSEKTSAKPADSGKGRHKDRNRDPDRKPAQRSQQSRAPRPAAGAADAPVSRVGVIARRGRFDVVEPVFGPGNRLTLDSGGRRENRLREGDLVLLAGNGVDRSGRARAERVIGSVNNARDVIEGLMIDRGLERGFDPEVEAEAKKVANFDGGDGREDLRELVTFTIDPTSARDFDDAISAQELPDGRAKVWVHIADVSAFVKPGSVLDQEARMRATSVYVPGAVEPMLPHSLSSGACSLVPDEDRLAVTIEMTFDGADVVESRLTRTIIRSNERLDYDEVDRILTGSVAAREPWAGPLATARRVSAALAERRRERHSLEIDRPEPEFIFDSEGMVSGWRSVEQTESHRLIEMLMIAANSEVAKMLVERKVSALHRVHERPDPTSVNVLLDRLASLDIPTPPAPKQINPSDAVRITSEASILVDHWTRKEGRGRLGITFLVLRALQQARYDNQPLGHSGLGLEHYCHFTSPIRRYPDIICHRAILAALGLGEHAPSSAGMAELGEWTSAQERHAMKIERSADDIASCFLLEKELMGGGETVFDGEVVGVIGAGLFVEFGGGFEGFLPVRRLRGSWWELNDAQTMLIADGSGKRLRMGDPVRVEVGRLDPPRGRCDLYPAPTHD